MNWMEEETPDVPGVPEGTPTHIEQSRSDR